MKDARKSDQTQAPGHFENQGPKQQAKRAAAPDLEERHQRTRDQAPTDTGREDTIRQQTYEMWEREGQPEGLAHQLGTARHRNTMVRRRRIAKVRV
jgi:hypothetical protein